MIHSKRASQIFLKNSRPMSSATVKLRAEFFDSWACDRSKPQRPCTRLKSACLSDMLKKALIGIYRATRGGKELGPRLIDARLLLCVHDEIVATATERDAPALAEILQREMEKAFSLICPSVKNSVHISV